MLEHTGVRTFAALTVFLLVGCNRPQPPIDVYSLYKLDPTAPWIGVRKHQTGTCAQLAAAASPTDPPRLIDADLLANIPSERFPEKQWAAIKAEFDQHFCTFSIPTDVSLTADEAAAIVAKLEPDLYGLRPDVPIVGGSAAGAPESDERLWVAAGLRGLLDAQTLFTRKAQPGGAPKLWVLDDVPEGYRAGHSLAALKSPAPVYGHGLMVARIAGDVACGDVRCEDPPVDREYLQVMPHATTSGPAGSLHRLAVMLLAQPALGRGVVNLSLGWKPVELASPPEPGELAAVFPAAEVLAQLGPAGQSALSNLRDGPTVLVLWALLRASCSGSAVVAGAGNETLLLPAKFGALRLTGSLCDAVGVPFDPTVYPDPRAVYAVGGLDDDLQWVYPPASAMVGHEQAAYLAALGELATNLPGDGWTRVAGASVAAATVSGSAALLMSLDPQRDPHRALGALRALGASKIGDLAPRPQTCAAYNHQYDAYCAPPCDVPVECDKPTAAELDTYVDLRTSELNAEPIEGPLPWAPVGPIEKVAYCYKC